MVTVSLCMIVKNEEAVLSRCLTSVKGIADEIIIVDTGSTDATKEIAMSFGAKVYDFPWIDDFSAARNFSFSNATMQYILWLDADDVLQAEEREKLLKLKETLDEGVDAVMMRYDIAFDSGGRPSFSYFRERLSKRARNFKWEEPVHEFLRTYGNIVNAEIHVTHQKPKRESEPGRNARIYEAILQRGETLSPRGTYYYARELKDMGRFIEAAERFCEFLASRKGWVEDNIAACLGLARCLAATGDEDGALKALFQSFLYDAPRAEVCCEIGYRFKAKTDYRRAAFWFSLVEHLERPADSWGFFELDSWNYVPFLECAVCYDRLGELEKAEYFNELAAAAKTDSHAVAHNRAYFASKKETRNRS
ncbi:MAG TPA: glycosyltransferase family 2 protein [Clostridia bacterium]|nr:glycosyltransferase family 2 protein [Clostridia bacterium]